jgi:hypothetical protein
LSTNTSIHYDQFSYDLFSKGGVRPKLFLVRVFWAGLVLGMVVLTGCGSTPGASVPVVDFLDLIEQVLVGNNSFTEDVWNNVPDARQIQRDQQRAFNEERRVIRFRQGDRIVLNRVPISRNDLDNRGFPVRDLVFGMVDSTQFTTYRPVSLTYDGERTGLISLDQLNWFKTGAGAGPPGSGGSSSDDEEAEVTFLRYWIYFDNLERSGNTISGNLEWVAFLENQEQVEPHWQWNRIERTTRFMEPGAVITSSNRRNITLDLRREILMVPSGTILDFDFMVEGNLVESVTYADRFETRVLRDFWVYIRSPRNVSLSFDGSDWRYFIWDFEFKNETKGVIETSRRVNTQSSILFRLRRNR